MMEDSKIIDLYFERSEEAITRTAEKYGRLCRSIALRIVGSYEDAQECENDTYVAVWNSIPPTRPNIFSAFLSRISRNIALNRYEYNRAGKRNSQFDLVLEELEECLASPCSVEDSYIAGEIAGMINEFLEKLKAETRVIFVRRYYYADSVKEIAQRLGVGESKVKTTLFRVRQELRAYLETQGVQV
ncbi:ECF RNA polymerase sigma factor SigE [Lachnospiraceae bacterium]|nr:sigma-70 family RNA polymerase sigma factor [Acetatifactor sp.]GFH94168.1 ECF RNA polymerase sigma factor SigE [Lachnospiraceae bacterium]